MNITTKLKTYILSVGAAASLIPANALTIDTSGSWLGLVNDNWEGSGQSLTVDATENFFETFSVYVHADSNGKLFDVQVSDALNGGNVLFSTSTVVLTGLNTIDINQAFTGGSTIFVQFDYNGFTGRTLHFQGDVYGGGNSSFLRAGVQENWDGLDHRFIAVFSGKMVVPEAGASLALAGFGVAGLVALRRVFAA